MKRLGMFFAVFLMAFAFSATAYADTSVQETKQTEREAKQALKAEKQAYREKAQLIREETKAVNAEIKEVNRQIKELRENFLMVRDSYRSEKILPNGWTKEDWKAFLTTKKELLAAASQSEETAVAEDVTEGVTVKDLVSQRRFDEALKLLTSKKEARLEKLAQRRKVLEAWKQVNGLLNP